MKYITNKFFTEVKDKRYLFHPTGNNILRERKETKSLQTQYQVIIETKIRRNQKVINDSGELKVESYPKKSWKT